jgi:hypothetical protein
MNKKELLGIDVYEDENIGKVFIWYYFYMEREEVI